MTAASPLVYSQVQPSLRRRVFNLSPSCPCSHLNLQLPEATWSRPGRGPGFGTPGQAAQPLPPQTSRAPSGSYPGIPHSGLPVHSSLIRARRPPAREGNPGPPPSRRRRRPGSREPNAPHSRRPPPRSQRGAAGPAGSRDAPPASRRARSEALGAGEGGGASSGAGGRKRAREENGAERRA